jgi:hypothetical protein
VVTGVVVVVVTGVVVVVTGVAAPVVKLVLAEALPPVKPLFAYNVTVTE